MHTYLDTKTIIINSMKELNESWISIDALQDIMIQIKDKLEQQGKLQDYHIWYVEDYYSIINSISFNNDIFEFNESSQNIFIRKKEMLAVLVENYPIDEIITKIIQDCINKKKGK